MERRKGGLREWKGHDPKVFDEGDDDAGPPLVHHAVSNFKAHVIGTYHGVAANRPQSYADEFCWRYNHRGMKAKFELLLADLALGFPNTGKRRFLFSRKAALTPTYSWYYN